VDPRLDDNRAMWEARVPVHVASRFYDVDGFVADPSRGPRPWEAAVLGDVTGLDLVHLQCHFGLDTLAWARVGARVAGLDFSPSAIAAATDLAARAGLADGSRFVCADVHDAVEAFAGERFDVVYVSLGALCWLPSAAAWAEQAAGLLRPGGRLFVHDVHPLSTALADDGERLEHGWYEAEQLTWTDAYSYTDGGEALPETTSHEWNHGVGEVVTALLGEGLRLDHLEEHPWTSWPRFPWLEQDGDQRWRIPADRPQLPLSMTLLATRPA
jgi:SAM-dependent methyltransferase